MLSGLATSPAVPCGAGVSSSPTKACVSSRSWRGSESNRAQVSSSSFGVAMLHGRLILEPRARSICGLCPYNAQQLNLSGKNGYLTVYSSCQVREPESGSQSIVEMCMSKPHEDASC